MHFFVARLLLTAVILLVPLYLGWHI